MKVKLDENVPASIADILRSCGHTAYTIHEQGLSGKKDAEVWSVVQSERFFFITLDTGFADVRRFATKNHEGILLLRPHKHGRKAIIDLCKTIIDRFSLSSFKGCLVVCDESRTRIKRP